MCDHEATIPDRMFDEIVGGVPYLLGFQPRDCVLVLPFIFADETGFGCAFREDLAGLIGDGIRPDDLAGAIHSRDWNTVVLMVIGGGTSADGATPPYQDQVNALDEALLVEGVYVKFSFWVPRLAQGEPWIRYCDDNPQRGQQKDPRVSQVAPRAVTNGLVVYDSQEDFANSFNPDDEISRRHLRILPSLRRASDARKEALNGRVLSWKLRRVHQAVTAAAKGELPRKDSELVALAWALDDPLIWQSSVCLSFTEKRPAAIGLWRHLTRELPGKHRAGFALLLALAAGAGCNTELARIALDIASKADPERVPPVEPGECLRYGVLAGSDITALCGMAACASAEIALIVANSVN